MADHPLRPATDRCLGGPLPHQLANRTSAAPIAQGRYRSPALLSPDHAVLAHLSMGYPPQQDTFRCITHPFATRRQGCPRVTVRLACVRHAASVQSEPGSNSSVQSVKTRISNAARYQTLSSPVPNLIYRASTSILTRSTQAPPKPDSRPAQDKPKAEHPPKCPHLSAVDF